MNAKLKKYVNAKNITLAAVIIIAIVLLSTLVPWAARASSDTVNIIECEVTAADGFRREYLVGEKTPTSGLSLVYDGRTITDCTVTCDMSTAGPKRLEVAHKDGNDYYRGYLGITVFYVRHLAVEANPTVSFDAAGELTVTAAPVIKADLNASPKELPVPDASMPSVIAFDSSLYAVDAACDETNSNLWTLTYKLATGTDVSFACVRASGSVYVLNSARQALELENKNGTADRLILYVTGHIIGPGTAHGVYEHISFAGTHTFYTFEYTLGSDYSSAFKSEAANGGGIRDSYIATDPEDAKFNEGMRVEVNGAVFRATKAAWHAAVFDGRL